ncbi:flap endonuclease GEN homolog 1 [Puntigrus tetrazona]|uniref:flap endonuclease GEN homolog 1 n=1 Tax=Puntigrus tetrazona TaxID=1606681 RepID=UPI001C8AEB25|nr:flap endonuclease GEN homolog 1 [Puntigrus tetrazona]XP_043086686.1 flap endonuclease GEN homolog 1 [Puntigrus tetrazona]XP_043086687.1 flap endonuclease GEN homolog 1 [Puntigrus tetrazona]
MGVSELWSILDPVRESVPLYSLSGKTLAVDLSLWVCEAQHVQGMMGKVTRPHLRNLFFRVSSLTLMGVKLVFVMEGDAPSIKAQTMSKRNEMRYARAKAKPGAAKNTSRGRFKAVLRECAEMLDCLGVPWVTAAGEAEAMCAFLDSQGAVDGCITNDGDAFLYGAQTVYRNFNMTTKDPQVDCYQTSRVRAELGLSRDSLVGLAVLLGCDYIPKGVAGVGKEQALKLIQNLKGKSLLQKFTEWGSDRAEGSEVVVKKVTHCLVCRHPGSAKAHERSGCVFCESQRFCSPQDYDSQCPCDWHRTEHTRQASSVEASVRKKTLASEHFPFTEVIREFLETKDRASAPFRRRKPSLLLMQTFALEKMDWPKHYSSEKLLSLMTYSELVNRRHGREPQLQPLRIHKPRVRNGVSCFEVVWKKPDHFVFSEGREEQTEVRTLEEESLFGLAFPEILQDFQQQRAGAQKRKPKARKEKPSDSHDAVSDLFAQMSLKTETDPDPESSQSPPPPETRPPLPSQNPLSESALIGQLHLSSIDWDSSSFTASPSQNPPSDRTDPGPAENTSCSPQEPLMTKNTRKQTPGSPGPEERSVPANGRKTQTSRNPHRPKKSFDSDEENRQRPRVRSRALKPARNQHTLSQVHHGTPEEDSSDSSLDSPRPLAERLKMRFAKVTQNSFV